MTMQTDERIEQELREAFRAAATTVHPRTRPLADSDRYPTVQRRSGTARRWLVPAVAAGVVAAIALPMLAFTLLRGTSGPDIQAASVVTASGDRAKVAGISFPVPDGWTTSVVGTTSTAVTVCVAARPATDCPGVTVRIAVPDGGGDITPLRDPLSASLFDAPAVTPSHAMPAPSADADPSSIVPSATRRAGIAGTAGSAVPHRTVPPRDPRTETCPIIVDTEPLGGRPAVHLTIGRCTSGSPQSASWYVTDGSLAISTPRGVAHDQAAFIAGGLDFFEYGHAYGPQIMFLSPPGVASSHAVAPTG